MHITQITAGIIRQGDSILLVEQQAPHDPVSGWSLPGGRVEAGEFLDDALRREIGEETGLRVEKLGALVYMSQLIMAPEDAQYIAYIFNVDQWSGEIQINDPDEVILQAVFLPIPEAIDKLENTPWKSMGEPIAAYLRGLVRDGSIWLYDGLGQQVRHTVGLGYHDG